MKSEKICYKSADGQWAMGNGQWASDRYLYVANIYGFHINMKAEKICYLAVVGCVTASADKNSLRFTKNA